MQCTVHCALNNFQRLQNCCIRQYTYHCVNLYLNYYANFFQLPAGYAANCFRHAEGEMAKYKAREELNQRVVIDIVDDEDDEGIYDFDPVSLDIKMHVLHAELF